jgi:hypothetical protein
MLPSVPIPWRLERIPLKSELAKAYNYIVNRRNELTRFATAGRLEADNSIPENTMRIIDPDASWLRPMANAGDLSPWKRLADDLMRYRRSGQSQSLAKFACCAMASAFFEALPADAACLKMITGFAHRTSCHAHVTMTWPDRR